MTPLSRRWRAGKCFNSMTRSLTLMTFWRCAVRRKLVVHSLLAWGAFVASTHVAGAAPPARQDTECKRYEAVDYPAADQPTAEQAKALKDCDAEAFYYGFNTSIDYVKARHCAFSTQDDNKSNNAGVLMMLYANGQGVTRNYTMARKAACDTDSASAELEGRMQHLASMQSGKAGTQPRIDICDDISSGMMQGHCAGIRSQLVNQKREQKFVRLTSNWNALERSAFQDLRKKAERFTTARSESEVDQSGTARRAQVLSEASKQEEDFFKSIQDFEAGRLPAFSRDDYLALDGELNRVYLTLRRTNDPAFGTVKMADIQRVQRIWLTYRDGWVRFGKLKYPSVPDYVWQAYFTKKRTGMLKELLEFRD